MNTESTPYEAEIGFVIYIWSDNYAATEEDLEEYLASGRSDDFERREGGFCDECNEEIIPHYGEPFASCGCCTREWYK